jgi:hypothetical protein
MEFPIRSAIVRSVTVEEIIAPSAVTAQSAIRFVGKFLGAVMYLEKPCDHDSEAAQAFLFENNKKECATCEWSLERGIIKSMRLAPSLARAVASPEFLQGEVARTSPYSGQ